MQAADEAIQAANEALDEAAEAVAEATDEQQEPELSESEAAASSNEEEDDEDEQKAADQAVADADQQNDQEKTESAQGDSVSSDETQVADSSSGNAGGQSAKQTDAASAADLQSADQAMARARQTLQDLIDAVAESQMNSVRSADADADNRAGDLPDMGSPEYQEALRIAVGEALVEVAAEVEKASAALASGAAKTQSGETAELESGSKPQQGSDADESSEGSPGEELQVRLAALQGLAQVMNAINEGMRSVDTDADQANGQNAGVRMVLAGDLTTVPGSILLPGGIMLPGGLGLPGMPGLDDGSSSGSGVILVIPGARTSADRVVVLDAQLSGSLATLDGVLLAGRGSKIGIAIGGGEFGDEGNDRGFGSDDGDTIAGEDDLLIAQAGQTAGEASNGQDKSSLIRKEGGNAQPSPPPEDIPDGSDDDIVARQLREAAENELDPVLRDKLWDEYRAYKKATGQ